MTTTKTCNSAAFLEGLDTLEGDELNDRANEALQYVHQRLDELGIENGVDVTSRIYIKSALAFVAETEKPGTVADRLADAEARLARIERREIDQAVALSKIAVTAASWIENNVGELADTLHRFADAVLHAAPGQAYREVVQEDAPEEIPEELGAAHRGVA